MKKIILLLSGGLVLGLSKRPDVNFRIIKSISKEWHEIDKRTLYTAIHKLYQLKMIDYKENKNGTIRIILNNEGRKKVLQFDFENIQINKMKNWDGLWRMIIFDIPERFKKGRDALSSKLKDLGFYSMQKSVFIHPYKCDSELDFIIEVLELRKYVRSVLVKETDIDLVLKHNFKL